MTPVPTPEGWLASTKKQIVETDFGKVVVRIGGNEHKPFMVFWPSLLLDASMWAYQFEHFAPDYRIVLIDPPGIGESAPLRQVIGVDQSVACLIEILDALHIDQCIMVGNSWGALVAAALAANYPRRLLAAVVINGTAAPPTPQIKVQMTELATNLEKCGSAPDWLLVATQQAFSSDTTRSQNPEFLAYLQRVLREDPVSVSFAMKGILLGREDLHPTMRRIKEVPVLVIAGEQDRVFDIGQSQSLADSISTSNFVLLPRTGHLAPRENPTAVNGAIETFLKNRLAHK